MSFRPTKNLFLVLALGLMALVGVRAIAVATDTPVSDLFRDPSSVLESGPHIGLLSTIGVVLWSATATVCLFASWGSRGESRRFLLWAGLFSLLLMLDDAFLLHDFVGPLLGKEYLHVPGRLVEISAFFAYFLLLVAYLTRFARYILRTRYVYLGVALISFAASLSIDVVSSIVDVFFPFLYLPPVVLLEDDFKFLGIVLWLNYFTVTAAASLEGAGEKHTPEENKALARHDWESVDKGNLDSVD